MGCFIGCLALAFPRIALGLVWFFGGDYVARAFEHRFIWPLLGFFFLPLTTLAFAYAYNSFGHDGQIAPLGWVIVALAGISDLGLWGGGGRAARRRRRRDDD